MKPARCPTGIESWCRACRRSAATFRLFCVLVLIEHGSRRRRHFSVTQHPSAEWTMQQLREGVGLDEARHCLVHDRDSILAGSLDNSIGNLRLTALKVPPDSPKTNPICERVIETIRLECSCAAAC